jgi:beta-galactosidase
MTDLSGAEGGLARLFAKFRYGGDYNPEQWAPDVVAADPPLMRQAGVSLVSLGIFAWARTEPAPGEYDFGWLDEVMDMLAAHDISICLATMTASPPPWLPTRHPETLPVTIDGTRLSPGARQHFCPSSPIYRHHAARLVEQLAKRYGAHDALALWHVGNEYGCHVRACYCEVSASAFRGWLVHRYRHIDALNQAWSTDFWSQRYGSFDEIQPPRAAPTFRNPAQQLDFARFSSDELLACYRTEADLLRHITPSVPLTTNFVPLAKTLDLFKWARHLDIVSYDSYPDPDDPRAAARASLSYDVIRGLLAGQAWLLMEQAPGAVNWRTVNRRKQPGGMRLWSWQAVAHGAASVMFFQWRQSRGGAEKFHSAMVPHGGASTRTFQRVCDLGRELAQQEWLPDATCEPADVAMLMDWENWWAFELDAHPHNAMTYMQRLEAHYWPLYDANIAVDVAPPTADLSRYRLVVVPNLYLLSHDVAHALARYVEAGGTALVSFFSGIVDANERVHLGGYPGPLRSLLGVHVQEFDPLPDGVTVGLTDDAGVALTGQATTWAEEIDLEGAQPVMRFAEGALAGRPAATRHQFGRGTAWYVGTAPDEPTFRALMDRIRQTCGVEPTLPTAPQGVQARALTSTSGQRYIIVLNHTDAPVELDLPRAMRDTLTGQEQTRPALAPRGVAALHVPEG